MIKSLFVTVVVLLSSFFGANSQSFEFIENKGQWDQHVKYKGELSTGAFFLQANGYRVLQHDTSTFIKAMNTMAGHSDQPTSTAPVAQAINAKGLPGTPTTPGIVVKSHAYDVSFEGGAPNVMVENERAMPGYFNYFIGNDTSKWTSNVTAYGAVVYKNVYPGIDVRYYSDNGFLKYDMIVQPNAPVSKIGLKYDGVEELKVKDGELYVKTSVATVREQSPYSYQLVNGVRKEVKCSYEVFGNRVKFRISGYDPSKVLIIDPTLIFCSFTGSRADNWGYTATYDGAGNLYAGGIVFGNDYPVTSGAFQTTWSGGSSTTGEQSGFDIGIMKFSANGSQRLYATFLGGSAGNEQPHSLVVDAQNNLIMAGRTTASNYPLMPAGNTRGLGGSWDIVITKLNTTGTAVIGSVRIGGTGNDGVNIKHKYEGTPGPSSLMRNYGDDARSEVVVDGANNIYLASCTQSTDFPTTGAVFQPNKSGSQDGLILKFNPSLANLLFATHIGGSGDDAAYVLAIAPDGDIYAAGGTTSANFPGDKSGTLGTGFGGGNGVADGFIARVSNDGSTLKKSTFIGTSGFDQVYGIQFDKKGFLYIQGTTTGSFPVINAAFSQPGGKQFIAKLQADMSAYVYFTNWGTNNALPNISPIAFLVDRCENVYVSGWGGNVIQTTPRYYVSGTRGLTTTPDAIKTATDGNDFYFIVLEKNATSMLYGSFFGQQGSSTTISDHVDGGTSRFDQDGIIYQAVCANCQGGQFPITPGVVGSSNPSGRCNEAVIKISFDLSGVRGGVKASINNIDGDTVGCVPLTVNFRDTVGLGKSFEWLFGDGSTGETTPSGSNSHTFNAVGDYRVRMIAVDSSKCYPRDTTYVTIRVRADRAPVLGSATKIGACESFEYRFDNLSTAPANKPFNSTSFLWMFGDNSPDVVAGTNSVTHIFPATGTYNVKLVLTDTNYCNAPDTFPITLRVSPDVKAVIETPATGCAPYLANFNNVSLGGSSFTWIFSDGTTSTETSPTKLYAVPGTYTIKLIARDPSTCNRIDSTEISIVVSGKPTAAFSFSPNPPEENIVTTFTNESIGGIRFNWYFGDGLTLQTIRKDTLVRHQYKQSMTYSACLSATNEFNCIDTVCKMVPIIINPLLDVVSAFTPNNDGVNDRAVVIGYGIEKMTFRIYNRWGQLMFESNDESLGWDGRYKGKPQPMDAYGYTLDANFYEGGNVKKSGSITLIR